MNTRIKYQEKHKKSFLYILENRKTIIQTNGGRESYIRWLTNLFFVATNVPVRYLNLNIKHRPQTGETSQQKPLPHSTFYYSGYIPPATRPAYCFCSPRPFLNCPRPLLCFAWTSFTLAPPSLLLRFIFSATHPSHYLLRAPPLPGLFPPLTSLLPRPSVSRIPASSHLTWQRRHQPCCPGRGSPRGRGRGGAAPDCGATAAPGLWSGLTARRRLWPSRSS